MSSSSSVAANNYDPSQTLMRQRYSLAAHPSMPALVCSDGYLCSVLHINAAHATHTRLIREMLNHAMHALNTASRALGQPTLTSSEAVSNEDHVVVDDDNDDEQRRRAAWSLPNDDAEEDAKDDNDDDEEDEDYYSGAETTKAKKSHRQRAGPFEPDAKVSAGKIIFTFMHQVLPISLETLPVAGGISSSTPAAHLATALGHVQSCWTLLLSLAPPLSSDTNTTTTTTQPNAHESEQFVRILQHYFMHAARLLLADEDEEASGGEKRESKHSCLDMRQFADVADCSRAVVASRRNAIVHVFVRMLKLLAFAEATTERRQSTHTAASLVCLTFVPRFVDSFVGRLLEASTSASSSSTSSQRRAQLGACYTLLNACESVLKSIYAGHQSSSSSSSLLVKRASSTASCFVDLMLEKAWLTLASAGVEHRRVLASLGTLRSRQLADTDVFMLLVQRRVHMFARPCLFNDGDNEGTMASMHPLPLHHLVPICEQRPVFRVNEADTVYLEYGRLDEAVRMWLEQLDAAHRSLHAIENKSYRVRNTKIRLD